VRRLLAAALLCAALPLGAQSPGAAYRLDTVAVRADGGAGGVNYATLPAPSGCTTGSLGIFLGSLTCVPGLTYAGGVLSVPGAVSALNVTATGLPTPGSITVTPTLSQLGGITVVAGSALADGDALSVGDGVGVVPIEFDAAPGDGTTGGAVAIVFDGTETATQIRDAVKAILDGAGRDWTTSAQGDDGIGLVRATPGATGGAITEGVTDAEFSVTDWTDPTHATTYTYSLQACGADGKCTEAGAASSTATSVATVSALNYNALTWGAVAGSVLYKIRRDVGGATQGVIWSGTALTVDDTGLAGDGTGKPLRDDTGVVAGAAGLRIQSVGAPATGALVAADVAGTLVSNYGQTVENTTTLPAAAAGYNFVAIVGTAGAGAWHIKAGASDKLYLDGVALDEGDKASLAAPALGNTLTCIAFQTGASAWDWICQSGGGATWMDGGA
jgi:hypothetical protein